jgi:release factor glutamine methyltransferase
MTSVGDVSRAAVDRLRAAGVTTPELDAELLLAFALGWSRARVLAERRSALDPAAAERVEPLVARRCRREPLAYLVGEREFWSLPLRVDARVLVPRPETETVVEVALARLRSGPPGPRRIADVGTGSGAIALALASELGPGDEVTALDRSASALAVARANRARLAGRCRARVELARADLLDGVASAALDLVVANPPYLSDAELARAEPELAFEPRDALAGGDRDGLGAVRGLLAGAARVLRAGGWAIVEIGAGQGAAAAAAALDAGLGEVEVLPDLAGRDRALVARAGKCTVRGDRADGAA